MSNPFRDKVSRLAANVSMAGLLDEREIGDASESVSSGRYIELPPDRFVPDPTQPRRTFDPVELDRFREGLEQDGQQQPIVVCLGENGLYNIIAGERRWRAISQSERMNTVQAVVRDGPVDDEQRLLIQIVENRDREDITVFEEAQAVKRFVDIGEAKGRSRAECGERLRIKPSLVSKFMAIAEAGEAVISLAKAGENKDIEALYLLAKLSARDAEAAEQLVTQFREGDLETSLRVASRQLLDATPKPVKSDKGGDEGGNEGGEVRKPGASGKPAAKKGPKIPKAKSVSILVDNDKGTYFLKVALSDRRSLRYRLDAEALVALKEALVDF